MTSPSSPALMGYLDFVDAVLSFIGQAVAGPDPSPPDLFDLAKQFGCDNIHDEWGGPLHHAIEFAARDLVARKPPRLSALRRTSGL